VSLLGYTALMARARAPRSGWSSPKGAGLRRRARPPPASWSVGKGAVTSRHQADARLPAFLTASAKSPDFDVQSQNFMRSRGDVKGRTGAEGTSMSRL
jgi:hypothetical protein